MLQFIEELCGMILIIANLSLVPLVIVSIFILYQNRNSLHFQKRGIAFLVVHLVLSLLNHGLVYPVALFIYSFKKRIEKRSNDFSSTLSMPVFTAARQALVNSFTIAIFLNIVFRLFYQFVQIQRSKHTLILIPLPEITPLPGFDATSSNNWEESDTISNHSKSNKTKSGGVKHKRDDYDDFGRLSFIFDNYNIFGNPTKICLIGFGIWILILIGFIFSNIASEFTGQNDHVRILIVLSVYMITLSGMIGSVIYLSKKQKIFKFEDHWNIRNEFKKYGTILAFAGMFFFGQCACKCHVFAIPVLRNVSVFYRSARLFVQVVAVLVVLLFM